jgi:GNAT superfamily N-acetyltransferase
MSAKPPPQKPPRLIIAEQGEELRAGEIAGALGAEVAAAFGPRDEKPLTIVAEDEQGALCGGLNGASHWRWLYIRNLWVDGRCRGQGVGRALLAAAATEARRRDCVGLYLDTFDPGAAAFYERNGFAPFGRLDDFPPGAARTFLFRRIED